MPGKQQSKRAATDNRAAAASSLSLARILVPIDFSETSIHALRYALPFASRFGASLHLAHIYEPPTFMSGYAALPITVSDEQLIHKAQTELDSLAARQSDSKVRIEQVVRQGRAYEEIVKLAGEQAIDLIIISTHGYTGLKHTLLGSTAERVVRHAPCPVLVVR